MSAKTHQIYQGLNSGKRFIRLEQINGNLWDYAVYTGQNYPSFDSREWSRSQIDDRRPGLSEWTLENHYRLFDESNTDKFYSIKRDSVYSASIKEKSDDLVVPSDILKQLFIEDSFEIPTAPLESSFVDDMFGGESVFDDLDRELQEDIQAVTGYEGDDYSGES